MVSAKKLESVCIKAAKTGGILAHSFFKKPLNVRFKLKERHAGSIVTQADVACEKAIRTAIYSHFPNAAVVGEEEGGSEGKDFTWFVDPIDGTANFARGFDFYGSSVGVAYKGKPVAGAVFYPETKKLFHASVGNGAFLNNRRIRVSKRKALSDCILISASTFHSEKLYRSFEVLAALGPRVYSVWTPGCASLAPCLIAEGIAELTLKFNVKPWDYCAAAITVREAGGVVLNSKMTPWTTADGDFLVAANKRIASQALSFLNKR